MADAGVDIAQLTPEQQEVLQQYTGVTNQEIKDAVPLLQRCQWNLQVCACHVHLSTIGILIVDRLQ